MQPNAEHQERKPKRNASRKIAVADCETDPFKYGRIPQPFLWGYYDGDTYEVFSTTEKFVNFIKEKDVIVYAHNGGKFDWHFLKGYIEPYQDIMLIHSRISAFKIGNCEFRDSYNLMPLPLKAYKKDDFDYNKMEKEVRHKHMGEINEYLKNDCIFLYEIVSEFIETFGLNLTLATSALKFWVKNFYTGAQFKSDSRFYNKFKNYYYGGRVECFKKGIITDEFKVYDINSAYPYAMLHNHAFGYGVDYLDSPPEQNFEQCFYTIQAISQGAFPYREKTGLTFPCDEEIREYHVTGWELQAALDTKTVKNVKYIAIVQFRESISFKDYVNHFYKMKNESKESNDKARYIISKLFLNSLYGKFGANPQKYKKYETIEAQFVKIAEKEDGLDFNGFLSEDVALVSRGLDDDEMKFYNLATAASITGFVRAYLWRAICDSEGMLYCDTDSIACVKNEHLKEGTELGQWECEGEFENGAICGKKLYAFKYKHENRCKIASKGVKLNEKEIFRVAMGEEITYKNIAPTFSVKNETTFLERKIKLT